MLDLIASYGGALTTELLCYNGDVETLAAMLHANPQLHFDEHALHAVIDMGHQQVMQLILRYQPDILERFALRRAKTPEFARWLMEARPGSETRQLARRHAAAPLRRRRQDRDGDRLPRFWRRY